VSKFFLLPTMPLVPSYFPRTGERIFRNLLVSRCRSFRWLGATSGRPVRFLTPGLFAPRVVYISSDSFQLVRSTSFRNRTGVSPQYFKSDCLLRTAGFPLVAHVAPLSRSRVRCFADDSTSESRFVVAHLIFFFFFCFPDRGLTDLFYSPPDTLCISR